MYPDLLFEPFEVTEFTERFHATIGRALIIATRFERNMKSLSSLFDLKADTSVLESDSSLEELLGKIERRPLAVQIESLLDTYPDLRFVLVSAKDARNHIAHEIAVGLDRQLDQTNTEFLSDQVLDIYDDVRSIAAGDMLVCTMIAYLTNEALPTNTTLTRYSAAVADWACNTDELGEFQ